MLTVRSNAKTGDEKVVDEGFVRIKLAEGMSESRAESIGMGERKLLRKFMCHHQIFLRADYITTAPGLFSNF